MHKKLDTVSISKRRVRGGNHQRVEEVAFAAMQEMQMLDRGVGRETGKKTANCYTEALKLKLLEALHTAPQKIQTTGFPDLEERENELKSKYQEGKVTHGITQNTASCKSENKLLNQINSTKKLAPASISDNKQKSQEKYAFAFDHREDKDGSMEWPVGGDSSRSGSKRSEDKKVTTEPRKTYFPRQDGSYMSFLANGREQILPSPKKAPLKRKGQIPLSKAKKSNVPNGSSDDTRETIGSHDREFPPVREETRAEMHFPRSPRKEQDGLSCEEDDLTSKAFRKPSNLKKSSSTRHKSKKVRIQEETKMSKNDLSSPSPIDTSRTEETAGSYEASEPHLRRSFSQMTSVLDGFNTKLKSHTSKKSSEILSSALDKIRLQLQAVESQIQADIGKLTNAGKSKRKHLESTFKEQHGRLRFSLDKFKEELNQQHLDCRTTLEELEAYQLELKGIAERQKASHRKLLMQAEEAVKGQLTDADTCIAAVNKEARHKMNGLKLVLEEWMGGEIC